ncbi:MAG: DUF2306 domain-containing protein [Paracoccaceae bacterium]
METLFEQASPIPHHVLAAFAAVILGAAQLWMPKGGRVYRILGYIWVALMAIVSLSSFFIHELRLVGAFSPIHLLSIFTLWSLFMATCAAKDRRINAHRRWMQNLYVMALLITGAFTFLPGRTMHMVLFGG